MKLLTYFLGQWAFRIELDLWPVAHKYCISSMHTLDAFLFIPLAWQELHFLVIFEFAIYWRSCISYLSNFLSCLSCSVGMWLQKHVPWMDYWAEGNGRSYYNHAPEIIWCFTCKRWIEVLFALSASFFLRMYLDSIFLGIIAIFPRAVTGSPFPALHLSASYFSWASHFLSVVLHALFWVHEIVFLMKNVSIWILEEKRLKWSFTTS